MFLNTSVKPKCWKLWIKKIYLLYIYIYLHELINNNASNSLHVLKIQNTTLWYCKGNFQTDNCLQFNHLYWRRNIAVEIKSMWQTFNHHHNKIFSKQLHKFRYYFKSTASCSAFRKQKNGITNYLWLGEEFIGKKIPTFYNV